MNQKQRWTRILEAIRSSLKTSTQAAVARSMGVSPSYLSRILNEPDTYTGEGMSADSLHAYELGLGILEETLPAHLANLDGFSLVPYVSARPGAGCSLMTDDEVEGHYAFRDDFLRSLGHNAKLKMYKVIGDSMEPTLFEGDMVLVDLSEKKIQSGCLYMLTIGEEFHIKRVYQKPDGAIFLQSDNKNHPSWEIPRFEDPKIHGRARWLGRVL